MTSLPERTLRFARFAVLAALCALGGCAPGSGGTGTGPVATVSFSSVTSGDLNVVVTSASAGDVSAGGPLTAAACGRIDLTLEDERVELGSACGKFVFTGTWAVDAGELATLHGMLEAPLGGAQTQATLLMQFSSAAGTSGIVTVTVTDPAGRALFGPAVLSR